MSTNKPALLDPLLRQLHANPAPVISSSSTSSDCVRIDGGKLSKNAIRCPYALCRCRGREIITTTGPTLANHALADHLNAHVESRPQAMHSNSSTKEAAEALAFLESKRFVCSEKHNMWFSSKHIHNKFMAENGSNAGFLSSASQNSASASSAAISSSAAASSASNTQEVRFPAFFGIHQSASTLSPSTLATQPSTLTSNANQHNLSATSSSNHLVVSTARNRTANANSAPKRRISQSNCTSSEGSESSEHSEYSENDALSDGDEPYSARQQKFAIVPHSYALRNRAARQLISSVGICPFE